MDFKLDKLWLEFSYSFSVEELKAAKILIINSISNLLIYTHARNKSTIVAHSLAVNRSGPLLRVRLTNRMTWFVFVFFSEKLEKNKTETDTRILHEWQSKQTQWHCSVNLEGAKGGIGGGGRGWLAFRILNRPEVILREKRNSSGGFFCFPVPLTLRSSSIANRLLDRTKRPATEFLREKRAIALLHADCRSTPPPFECNPFIVLTFQHFLVFQYLMSGWAKGYSFRCQPVDYSHSPMALRMVNTCWWYFISKFTEFFDTVSPSTLSALLFYFLWNLDSSNGRRILYFFLSAVFHFEKEDSTRVDASRDSPWYNAFLRMVGAQVRARWPQHFLRPFEHFCSYNNVLLLHGGCDGPSVSKVHLVEETPDYLANGKSMKEQSIIWLGIRLGIRLGYQQSVGKYAYIVW